MKERRCVALTRLTHALFSVDSMLEERLMPFTSSLLASLFQHHDYYKQNYGDQHIMVHHFERSCDEVGISADQITRFGRLIQDDVDARNNANLASVAGLSTDAATEIRNMRAANQKLASEVAGMHKKLDRLTEAVFHLVEENNKLKTNQLHNQAALESSTITPTVDRAFEGASIDRNVEKMSTTTDGPSTPSIQQPPKENAFNKMMGAKQAKYPKVGYFILSKNEKLEKFTTVDFLVTASEFKLNFDVACFGGTVSSQKKRRAHLIYQHFQMSIGDDNFVKYKGLAEELRAAKYDGEKSTVDSARKKLKSFTIEMCKLQKEIFWQFFQENNNVKRRVHLIYQHFQMPIGDAPNVRVFMALTRLRFMLQVL